MRKSRKSNISALRRAGKIPKAILLMCVLVVKNNKDGRPLCSKSWILVLGDFEDRLYQKPQRYAPVLKYSSLRLLISKAVGDKRILQQGDCKNAFCNATLTDNEVTFRRPPIGDPDFQEDDYGSWRKNCMDSFNHPIIGTIWSKGFSSRRASKHPHMIPASFLVYLKIQTHRRPSQRTDPNFTSASMLTNFSSTHNIHPRRPSSRTYSKNTFKLISW